MFTHPLISRLLIAKHTVETLLNKIDEIEKNTETPANEKSLKIKKIREEMTKVRAEIDNIGEEIKLLRRYQVN